MSSSSTSVSNIIGNPRIFKVDLDGNVYCHHDIVAVLRVVRRKTNHNGQQFYGCSQWPRFDCKFFLWKQDFDVMIEAQANITPSSYEALRKQNLDLVQENKMLKGKICAANSKWKKLFFVLIVIAFWLYLSK
ncbi:hypothetical protein QVD17_33245 [Tagetes erecta]|uniref:GRF-type domain-containing protein n=1 Tax=Tagetes erecta TaxID=13708 RepID=A0AAD8NL77_TARER|nr:hypothetical protein QVD17_33245 [Tagetes erecta]